MGGGELGVGFTGAAEDNGQNGRRMTSEREKEDTTLSYIFVGDVGELDREAGELMLIKYPRSMRALFLHVVSSEPDPPLPQDILINGLPVLHFRTYVQVGGWVGGCVLASRCRCRCRCRFLHGCRHRCHYVCNCAIVAVDADADGGCDDDPHYVVV